MNSSVPTFYFYYITLSHSSDVDSILVWREYYSFAETLGATPCLPSLDMPSDTPHFLFSRRAGSSKRGFTLIELLVVIAIILVLAGITFGISRGVQNAQARTSAKAELAVIAQALEGYKSTHGDYPWAINSEELTKALMGWMKFMRTGSSLTFKEVEADDVSAKGPKSFIDATKLRYSGTLPKAANEAPDDVEFLDPWGSAYVYKYKTSSSGSWNNFGFVLYSKGADGFATAVGPDGIITTSIRNSSNNIDNIYSGE